MKNWLNKNYKTLIVSAFLIPIITVALVSISHVTEWYGISNPLTWSIYLSVGIEIAALSALAAISANMGKKVYFPFLIVTLIQFIGNIYFAYSHISIDGESFKMWVELVSPLLELMGIESTDFIAHKRFLSLFAGGMLPIISLSFLHMLVKFTEEDKLNDKKETTEEKIEVENDIIQDKIDSKDLIAEVSRLRLSEDDLNTLEKFLSKPPPPNDNLVKSAIKYQDIIKDRKIVEDDFISDEEVDEMYSITSNTNGNFIKEDSEVFSTIPSNTEEETQVFSTIPSNNENIFHNNIIPSLSDEEIMEMNQDEYERKLYFDDLEKEIVETSETEDEIETPIIDSDVEKKKNQ